MKIMFLFICQNVIMSLFVSMRENRSCNDHNFYVFEIDWFDHF